MGFLTKLVELIFGKIEKIQHPFFGEMIDAGNYYECRRKFKSINEIVEIGLEKGNSDSDQNQIEFFNWLDNNYEELIDKISPILENKIKEMIPEYKIDDFKKNFRLAYLYIPKCEEKPFQWKIGFDEINELQHYCFITMNELDVLKIHIDG